MRRFSPRLAGSSSESHDAAALQELRDRQGELAAGMRERSLRVFSRQ